MKNIVVTGANGFTGSHVLESFKQTSLSNYKVLAACRNESKLPNWYNGARVIGDLSDKTYIDALTQKADIICHAAAWAEMNGTLSDSNKYFFEPTKSLIDLAVSNRVKRFVFLSSTTSNPVTGNRVHSKKKLYKIWPHYHNVIRIENLLQKIGAEGKMEVVILRAGLFTGKNYSLGILPILLPRLKTRLVPWVKQGTTSLPLTNGKDVGNAFRLASIAELSKFYYEMDIVGEVVPTVKEVFQYLHDAYKYPLPYFSVSFKFAYRFARFIQLIHRILPGDPLIVPAIVLLLEETNPDNKKAMDILNYFPQINWKESIDIQINEMSTRQTETMKMNRQ